MAFEGNHKVIPIKGIARAGADTVCEDGAMNEVIGLEYKDGSYVPYKENSSLSTKIPADVKSYRIHKTSTGNNVILYRTDNNLYWMPEEEFINNEIQWSNMKFLATNVTNNVEFIGNLVCIPTRTGILYMIFEPTEGTYSTFQSSSLQSSLPRLYFRVSMYRESDDMKGAYNEGNLLVVKGTAISKGDGNNIYTVNGALQTVRRVVDLTGKGERSEIANLASKAHYLLREKGRITGYVLALYAYKLKTGEYIYASSPVLLGMPKADAKVEKKLFVPSDAFTKASDGTSDRLASNIRHYGTGFKLGDDDYTLTNCKIKATDKWGVGVNPEYEYEQKDTNVPPIFAWYHNAVYNNEDSLNDSSFMVGAFGNILKCAITSNIPDELQPIIDSCCIFLSDIVSPYDFKESNIGATERMPVGYTGYYTCGYYFNKKTDEEIKDEILGLRNFYKVHEIPFAKITSTGEFTVDLEGKLGDNLFTQDVLPMSAFDHTSIISPNMNSYNYRLHLSRYKQKLFKGYELSRYYDGEGQLPSSGQNTSYSAAIQVLIKSQYGYSEVWLNQYSCPELVNSMVTYPDSNAYKMVIYRNSQRVEIELKPSANGGYACGLKGLGRFVVYSTERYETPDTTNVNDIIERNNYLKVSETYTPNYFSLINTYVIGNGAIIGLASFSTSLSQDTFGQYPLLIFCTDGIYSMGVNTTGTGVYDNIAPFSREVCVNAKTICEIDGAVLFASSKGLMIATPQGVQEFLPELNGKPRHLPQKISKENFDEEIKKTNGLGLVWYGDIISSDDSTQMKDVVSKEDFIDFLLEENTVVSYVSEKNKIIVYNAKKEYTYWIDIKTRFVTKLHACIKMDNNDYPTEQYVKNDGTVITFHYDSSSGDTQCLVQTRPIKIINTFKSILRVVVRGYFESDNPEKYACLLVLGSYDAINWQPLGYRTKAFDGGFNDLGTITDRVSCKYIMVIVTGCMNSNSHIDGIELTENNKYNNKLK